MAYLILTYNKIEMRQMLLILAVSSLISCKTENIYLTVFPVKRVTEITDTIYIVPANRFGKEFQRADSLFNIIEKASDEAMMEALKKTKHLIQ